MLLCKTGTGSSITMLQLFTIKHAVWDTIDRVLQTSLSLDRPIWIFILLIWINDSNINNVLHLKVWIAESLTIKFCFIIFVLHTHIHTFLCIFLHSPIWKKTNCLSGNSCCFCFLVDPPVLCLFKVYFVGHKRAKQRKGEGNDDALSKPLLSLCCPEWKLGHRERDSCCCDDGENASTQELRHRMETTERGE